MRYNPLGKTGLFVSELCLGTMTFGGKGLWQAIGELGAKEAETLVGTALDAGVNFIDTADVYSEGESGAAASARRSRRSRGRASRSSSRPRCAGASGRASTRSGCRAATSSRASTAACGGSGSITSTSTRSTASIRRRRSRRRCARSTTSCARARRATSASATCRRGSRRRRSTFADANGLARFQSAQVYYSIAGRDIEREIAPLCQAEGVAILPWSPLAGGLLSGKFDPDKKGPADARRATFDFPPVEHGAPAARARRRCATVAEATGVSVARVALAWQLTKPFVTSIIIGAKKREQLVDNLAAAELRLSPEHVKAARRGERAARSSIRAGWSTSRTRAIRAASWAMPTRGRDPRGRRPPQVDGDSTAPLRPSHGLFVLKARRRAWPSVAVRGRLRHAAHRRLPSPRCRGRRRSMSARPAAYRIVAGRSAGVAGWPVTTPARTLGPTRISGTWREEPGAVEVGPSGRRSACAPRLVMMTSAPGRRAATSATAAPACRARRAARRVAVAGARAAERDDGQQARVVRRPASPTVRRRDRREVGLAR